MTDTNERAPANPRLDRVVAGAYREHWPRLLASLIRELSGDFDLAEEALQAAFVQACESWAKDGVPDQPRAWLRVTARRRALDKLRRRQRLNRKHRELLAELELRPPTPSPDEEDPTMLEDDRLRLLFTCCHPALAMPARVALTLRTLGGLSTDEIARAFLVESKTMGQRLVRAKKKILGAGIPYRVPADRELGERLGGVLAVIYLVFNEGYSASSGDDLLRHDLSREAIRLARVLAELMPGEPEVLGLLALLLLSDSRREARVDDAGDLVLLADQDRSRWDHDAIAEGGALVERALRDWRGAPGPYSVQAAISSVHAQAAHADETDWPQISALYAVLRRLAPTPVVDLNAAVAVAMARTPAEGLARIEELAPALGSYAPFHAARADMLRRLGRRDAAVEAYRAAAELTGNAAEARYFARRIAELGRD